MATSPKLIVTISGKRKSGKDYVTDKIFNNVGEQQCKSIRVADPVKKWACRKYGMDYSQMLTSCPYKEQVRKEMIEWDAEQRKKDKYVFCKDALQDGELSCKEIWILSDARRIDDVIFFQSYSEGKKIPFYCVRVVADENTRKMRNWEFVVGIDDAESECGLDGYEKWDFLLSNSLDDDLSQQVENLCKRILKSIS